jgi:hypothetical protein
MLELILLSSFRFLTFYAKFNQTIIFNYPAPDIIVITARSSVAAVARHVNLISDRPSEVVEQSIL